MSLFDSASLCVTPNGVKEGKLYSIKPSDGSGDLSVTRATTATRVNSAGLVEVVPYNLLTYSEQFDNADWNKVRSTIIANSTIAPNGITTADSITCTETTNSGCFIYQSTSLTTERTISIYVKPNTCNYFQIHRDFGSGVLFNLSNGTIEQSLGGTGTITSVGNGWYRCTATFTVSGTTLLIFGNSTMTITTWNSTSGETAYIWGAQLVSGTSAKDYYPTTTRLNIPRLDYTNGSCPSILVEPQRTNLATYSEDFTNVVWGKYLTTITANTIISPSGVQNADTFETSTNSSGVLFINSFVTSGDKTFSIYAKKGNNDIIDIGFTDVTDFSAKFNLTSGTLVSQTSGLTSTITNVGNGWYRLTVSKNITALASIFIINTTPLINKTIYIWGAQLEAGSYATSYIPTTSASVTRNADVISKTGISSLIGQTEGTLFLDHIVTNITGFPIDFELNSDNIGTNNVTIYYNGNLPSITIRSGGSIIFDASASAVILNSRNKIALAYKQNDFVAYINGVQFASQTSGNAPLILNNVRISDGNRNYKINSAQIYKTRLTNTELASLTSL